MPILSRVGFARRANNQTQQGINHFFHKAAG
jgi:hypothetical protein